MINPSLLNSQCSLLLWFHWFHYISIQIGNRFTLKFIDLIIDASFNRTSTDSFLWLKIQFHWKFDKNSSIFLEMCRQIRFESIPTEFHCHRSVAKWKSSDFFVSSLTVVCFIPIRLTSGCRFGATSERIFPRCRTNN